MTYTASQTEAAKRRSLIQMWPVSERISSALSAARRSAVRMSSREGMAYRHERTKDSILPPPLDSQRHLERAACPVDPVQPICPAQLADEGGGEEHAGGQEEKRKHGFTTRP